MQELWQEIIGESGNIYSRLWKFGMRALKFRDISTEIWCLVITCWKKLNQWRTYGLKCFTREAAGSKTSKLASSAAKSPESEDTFMEDIVM